MKFCIDDKYVKDDKDENDDNDDENNDVNEHLVKLDSDKTDQPNEANDNNPDYRSLVCPLGQVHDKLLWGRFRHLGLNLDHRFLDHLLKDLFCSTYLFTGAHFCCCIHGQIIVTLGLPRSHPGEKNGITQRLHLSPLSVRYYFHLTKNETWVLVCLFIFSCYFIC